MSRFRLSTVVLGLLLAGRLLAAAEFFVSPTGTDRGKGSQKSPWSLAKALSHPGAVHAGDTIWLRGGTYTGIFTSYLRGTAKAPIIVRQYPGERATLDGNVNPSQSGSSEPVLKVHNFSGYTWYWGFEVTNSSPIRTDTNPCTHCRGDGIFVSGPGTKIINVIVHDTGQGITFWSAAVDAELYGNIIYYVGWSNPGGVGHSIYTQNYEGGSKLINHNVLFDPFSYNLHAYGSPTAGFVNSRVEGNVWCRGKSLVGGENGFDIGGTSVTANFSWAAPLNMGYSTTKCANVTVRGNYLTNLGGSVFSPGSTGCRVGETITTNTFVGDLGGFALGDYPNNAYYAKTSPPTQDKVTILPNAYEPERATIVIYNWDGSATQAVDLTGVVSPGAAYEIRNAQNFYGPPVVSGTYAGGSVTLPMTGMMPAAPVGYEAPLPTGPQFNVFIVLPHALPPRQPRNRSASKQKTGRYVAGTGNPFQPQDPPSRKGDSLWTEVLNRAESGMMSGSLRTAEVPVGGSHRGYSQMSTVDDSYAIRGHSQNPVTPECGMRRRLRSAHSLSYRELSDARCIKGPVLMVSVIMPAFDASRYIATSIESVRAQSSGDWELIVVDDGSTDDTGSIADGYAVRDPRIRVIHQSNLGIAAARNRGLCEMDAVSAYVAFLDNDDVWERGTLETLLKGLRETPNAVGIHGVLRYIDAEGMPLLVNGAATAPRRRRRIDGWRLRKVDVAEPTTFDTLAYGDCIPACSVLIRRAAIEKAGMFDPCIPLVDDWDMWLRLSLHGDFLFVNQVMYAYRLHTANASRDSDRKNEWLYYVRRKIHALPGLTSSQRRSISLGYKVL